MARAEPIYRPAVRIDLLHIPLLGRLLRARYGRLLLQVPLGLIALLIFYDGLTGPQLAPMNSATVLAWVHYRGLILVVLLLAGNLFCSGCPFTLPRTLARRLSLAGRRWPRPLRNKWLSIAGLLAIFWIYEWLDLWASPALTAWVVIAYFLASFTLEALFHGSPFCKYICPLGAFNFAYATASPLAITTRDPETCRTCPGKECVRGSARVPGCGLELYVPAMQSNLDCTFCLDCARACPYDNVALTNRTALFELTKPAWPKRWDISFLAISLVFFGLSNAFGMVPPVHDLQGWLLNQLGIASEGLRLLLILVSGAVLLPAVSTLLASWLSARAYAAGDRPPLRAVSALFAPAFIPLGAGIWFAHYAFHFIIGGSTLLPVLQEFALDHGVTLLGTPNWGVGFLLPQPWILPLQIAVMLLGYFFGLYILARRALEVGPQTQRAFLAMLPWALIMTALTIVSLLIFNLPMDMRGAMGTM